MEFFCFSHGTWDVVAASVQPFYIDILAGLGVISVAPVQDSLGLATPPGGGAIAAAMVQRQLGAVTLAGSGAAHA